MSLRTYLPSSTFLKPVGITLLVVIVVVVGGKLLSKQTTAHNKTEEEISLARLSEQDTDSDGLPDWEEALWGLDPANKDSDNDGILDEKEVRSARTSIEQFYPQTKDDTPNHTTQLAEQVYTTVASMVASSDSVKERDIARVSSEFGQAFLPVDLPVTFTKSDLKVVPLTESMYRTYNKAISILLQAMEQDGVTTEIASITSLTDTNDRGVSRVLRESVASYAQAVSILKSIPVPEILLKQHLALLNALHNSSAALVVMSNIENDPVLATTGLSQYRVEMEQLILAIESYGVAFAELNNYFASH